MIYHHSGMVESATAVVRSSVALGLQTSKSGNRTQGRCKWGIFGQYLAACGHFATALRPCLPWRASAPNGAPSPSVSAKVHRAALI
jgi:hypothetical protein